MSASAATAMMTAIGVRGGTGPAEALQSFEIAKPEPKHGQILIRVAAAGVNRPDILQRNGAYPPPPGASDILGLEVAGEVVAVGDGAPRWRIGDRVCALLGGGGYAQYVTVDARHALPIPAGLDAVQAAALPETVFTVFSNLFEIGALRPGETLFLQGAASGIGTTAIQMAKAAGARVIAAGRGADKAAAARRLGADLAIDTTIHDFVQVVREAGGCDVVLDMVAGDDLPRRLECLKPDGRLVVIGLQGGSKATLDIGRLMVKRLTVAGSTLRPRGAEEKARLAQAVERTVWPWIEAGLVRPVIDRTFPLDQAAAAHAWLEGGGHVGKVVLVP